MGDLIEVLTSNPFIIIILIGFISSLFKRFKATPESPDKNPRPTKIPEISIEDYFPAQPKPAESKKELSSYHQDVLKKLKEKTQAEIEKKEDLSLDVEPTMIKNEHTTKQLLKTPLMNEVQPQLHFSRKKLVEGIILSEVLGPPRSKKPFFRNR
ncbi:hypothetical protein [Peribacillus acanthi]|uniref:hypothetical protein n=1 Tax=Peribacillus acanthi TaxID=2171554 RepID=UPI000D3E0D9E|nr:hypothetical protein [Peribacillus acanthi]